MEPLPTVEEIYRDEIGLDEFITADLKALVKSFRKAYERLDGVDFTSEPMKLSSSREIRAMAVKFLEVGILADPRTNRKEVPAANTLWVRARGSFSDYRKDRARILASLSRLFARQNRYRVRNVNARGEQRSNEAGDVRPSVEDPDLPDVDDILRAKEPTRPKNKEGEMPQTRSGRPYNNDPSIADPDSTGADGSHTKFAAPVATMTQGPSWGCFASSGIDSKPPKNLTSESIKTNTSAMPTMAGADIPAEQIPLTTAPNRKRHAYVTSEDDESSNINTLDQDSALAEALAAASDVTQGEVESIIEAAIRQMDPKQPEFHRQERRASPFQPSSEDPTLKSEQLKRGKQPEPVTVVVERSSKEKNQSTEPRTSGDTSSAAGERVIKRPKMVNRINDAYKVTKPKNDPTQLNNKPTGPGRKEFPPAQDLDCSILSPPAGTTLPEAGASSSAADAKCSLGAGHPLKRPNRIHTNPRLASRMLSSRRKPVRRSSHLTHQDLRAHTLPPSLDEMHFEKAKAPKNSDVVERVSAASVNAVQDPHMEVAATGAEDHPRSRNDRQMSQTLEPEPIVGKTMLEQSPAQCNLTSSPRKPRIAVRLWILAARVPRVEWTQWADASLSAQTVNTIFQAVDEVSQFRNVDLAHVRFETDEQIWTYTIRKDDPDHFEDMKRSIIAGIKATTRKNRNNNKDFKILIEPVGVEETSSDEAMGDADDEVIRNL